MFYFLSGLVAVIAGYYGSLEKPYRKKMLPLILASIVLYLFGGMFNILRQISRPARPARPADDRSLYLERV